MPDAQRIEKARLSKILYPRDEPINQTWCVSEWIVDDFTITVTGVLSQRPFNFEEYTLVGKWETHPKYGRQLKLQNLYRREALTSPKGIRNHLQHIMTEGQLKNLYDVYPDPTNIFSGDKADAIEALCKVKGYGKKKATALFEKFHASFAKGDGYLQLKKLGLTEAMIANLTHCYSTADIAYARVTDDPYEALTRLSGIGFKRADALAMSMGIGERSHKRVAAYIKYTLRTKAKTGQSWLTKKQLLRELFIAFGGKQKIYKEYSDGSNNFFKALDFLKKQGIVGEDISPQGESRVYLMKYSRLEREVAKELMRLQSGECTWKPSEKTIDARIAQKEARQGWKFTEAQREGIQLAIDNQVCLITGGAGTGKSTLVSGLLSAFKDVVFSQTALSGKAAARLQSVTGREGMTIHRLIQKSMHSSPIFDKCNPLPIQMVILDEISLLGGDLFLELLQAIPTGAKLIILGDMNQLEAIGCMNIAHDLFESPVIPTIKLTEILRQAKNSGIITLADDVRRMHNPFKKDFDGSKTLGELHDMHVTVFKDRATIPERFKEEYIKWFSSPQVNTDPMKIHVLAPVRSRGSVCVQALNNIVQSIVNPAALEDEKSLVIKTEGVEWVLGVNDKVMCIRNNYKMEKLNSRGAVVESSSAVFNGWTGVVRKIEDNKVTVYFYEGRGEYEFTFSDIPGHLMLGYASTVHKFQGSSAPVIMGVVDSSTPPHMLTKELMYTLLTRAENTCVLLTQNSAFAQCVNTSGISSKQTFLEELLVDNEVRKEMVKREKEMQTYFASRRAGDEETDANTANVPIYNQSAS